MAHFHVNAMAVTRSAKGGAAGFGAYLARSDIAHDDTLKFSRYIERDGHAKGDDLIATGHGHLPQFAHNSAAEFWAAVDQHEYKNGLLARHYQISLPRELSEQGRLDLAHDLVEVFFSQYPHQWAVHNPTASDGQDNPHVHILFSTRRDDTDKACDAQTWFKKGGAGVRKDAFWDQKSTLQGVRHESAVLINAALEREGIGKAVSADRLVGQGHGRRGVHYPTFGTAPAKAQAQYMQVRMRRRDVQGTEQEKNVPAWHQQKAQHGLKDLEREAVKDLVRNRFWRHDTSPRRAQERQQSIERVIVREHQRTSRPLQGLPRTPIRGPHQKRARVPTPALVAQLAALARRVEAAEEVGHGTGLHVRLHDEERDRGLGW